MLCKVDCLSKIFSDYNVCNSFLNVINSKSIHFVSNMSGDILYCSDNSNSNLNIFDFMSNFTNLYNNININDFCFQDIVLDNNLEVYCLPYFLDTNNHLYFWIKYSDIDFGNPFLHSYLNNLVLNSKFLDSDYIIAITNKSGQINYVNNLFCEISKYSSEELIGKTHRVINSDYHGKSYFKEMWNTILNKKIWIGKVCNKAKDGSFYWTHTIIIPSYNEQGQIVNFISIRRDITEARKKFLIKEDTTLFKNLSHVQNSIFQIKLDCNNNYIVELLEGKIAMKYNLSDNVIGKRLDEILPLDFNDKFVYYVNECVNLRTDIEFEITSNKSTFLINLNSIFIKDVFVRVIGSILDISFLKENSKLTSSLLLNSSPTCEFQLINPNLNPIASLEDVNKSYIFYSDYCTNYNSRFALLYLSLDRLKYISDVFGYCACEELVYEISKRLTRYLDNKDSLYRYSNDDFIIFIHDVEKYIDFENYIEGIVNCFYDNYKLIKSNIDLSINCNLGISIYPFNGEGFDILLTRANTAMYLAKDNGKNNYIFYNDVVRESFERRVLIENELKNGLFNNEFCIYLQGKYDAKSEVLYGAEALLRWNNSKLGFISPVEFIPIAEETGLINEIGSWVLKESIKKLYEWNNLNNLNLTLSVNVSVNQLLNNRFLYDLEKYLKEYDIDTKYLDIEITESSMLDFERVQPILNRIKSKGIVISIDDFGTGYSSLTYLSNLSIDYLKIDQSFVRNLTEANKSIIKTIINLAHNMNIKTIAEGVESKEHVDFLLSENCDYFQGYYFSKPVCISIFEDKLLNLSI